MSDRELLELAAKAFWGDEIDDVCSIRWSEDDQSILYTHGDNQDHNGCDREYRWNPLDESHDAFELAVKLSIEPGWYPRSGYACARAVPDSGNVIRIEEYGTDPSAATRRAIVRAAAAIAQQRGSGETQVAAPTNCAAGKDGDCNHARCPQIKDGEPRATGRHCPLDHDRSDS